MLRWFEHHQVFQPDRTLVATGTELGRPFEDVMFQASDGIGLNGWYYPATESTTSGRLAALVCHGNAGNISTRLGLCAALLELGFSVFLFDYRGYGRSQGRPSEPGTYLDAEAAYEWLLQKGFNAGQIIAVGESLGGGVAAELATRKPLAGLVVISSFSCTTDLGAELFPWLPVRRLARIKYETCSKLPRLKIPVLIMHSRADQLIGFHHAQKNFGLANEPKMLWEIKGRHNDPLADRGEFLKGFEQFLKLVEQGAKQGNLNATQA